MAEIDLEIWCSCGSGLCRQTNVDYGTRSVSIIVEPCEDCLEKARNEGYEDGHKVGFDEGFEKAKEDES